MKVGKLMTLMVFGLSVGLMGAPALAQDDPIGHIIIATSDIKAVGSDAGERSLTRRSPVYEGDTVLTGENGRVQIRFVDGTIMTLSPQTSFRVDEYRSQVRGDRDDAMTASLIKGGLRSVTGSITKRSPDAFKINTDVATIGIRGTHFNMDRIQDGLFFGASLDNIEACNENGCLAVGDNFASKYGFVGLDKKFVRLTEEEAAKYTLASKAAGVRATAQIVAALEAAAAGDGGGGGRSGGGEDGFNEYFETINNVFQGIFGEFAPGFSGTTTFNVDLARIGAGADVAFIDPSVFTLSSISWGSGITVDFDAASIGLGATKPVFFVTNGHTFAITSSPGGLVFGGDTFALPVSGIYSNGSIGFSGSIGSPLPLVPPDTFVSDGMGGATAMNVIYGFSGAGIDFDCCDTGAPFFITIPNPRVIGLTGTAEVGAAP